MEIWEMRARVKAAYKSSPTWASRVDKMSDEQVVAIYHRLLGNGRIK